MRLSGNKTEDTMQTIQTQHGEVQLQPIERDLFIRIRQLLPYGIIGMQKQGSQEIEYGIVMQCDDEEVFGIKLQPIDVDKEQAHYLMQANTFLITNALPIYLQSRFDGVMLPVPYLRDKGDRFESGIAMFIFPDPEGRKPDRILIIAVASTTVLARAALPCLHRS
jgi:hypothetical protein